MSQASITLDPERQIGAISPLLFGGFAEHMGRCIYGGVYDPGSPHADARGFRRDVLAALKELNFRIIRYPGGNFLSGYHWQDGVGPRAQRPRRRELAWHSIETNQFGTNEFIDLCHDLGTLPMLGVNFGTGTIEEAATLVEYCNAPAGTVYSDLRAAHGYRDPHGVRYWCLGNEMDGPWQIGHLEAHEYGRKALEAAKLMKWHDPSILLTLCGSSSSGMATYPEWDRVALELCYEQVDFHSMHYYANNRADDTASFLALSAEFETYVDTLAATLRYVKAKRRSKRDVFLSWDEWNVWYKDMTMDGSWTEAPHLIEEVYNLEDALVVAQWLSVFLRKCDVLKIACLAQIVNIIAPILTTTDAMVKQTIFYPLMLFSRLASGQSLDVLVKSPLYATKQFGDMPLLDVSASFDPATERGAAFIVNRDQRYPLTVDLHWRGAFPVQVMTIHQISGDDPKAANTFAAPNTILPRQVGAITLDSGQGAQQGTLQLPPLSFTTVELRTTPR
jgi:alpha-N-arabinofuranosidase